MFEFVVAVFFLLRPTLRRLLEIGGTGKTLIIHNNRLNLSEIQHVRLMDAYLVLSGSSIVQKT